MIYQTPLRPSPLLILTAYRGESISGGFNSRLRERLIKRSRRDAHKMRKVGAKAPAFWRTIRASAH